MGGRRNPTRIWHLFKREDLKLIERAIGEAERKTSAELRVALIHSRKEENIRAEAIAQFQRMGMDRTADRSGVLILLAAKQKEFAIFADEGINAKVQKGAWDKVRDVMSSEFGEGRFLKGILTGLELAGDLLEEHFPWREGDKDELPNEVEFEK